MDLITHCLTPMKHIHGIRSLSEFGNPGWAPRPNSALPPRCSHEAIPKYISERTSYLQVRLEFHRYPPHPVTFQRKSVRPSIQCYLDFSLDMGRSPGFGSTTIYCGALFRLAFAAAPHSLLNLAYHRKSPVHSTKGTPSPINGL